jgi:hypothetical protein
MMEMERLSCVESASPVARLPAIMHLDFRSEIYVIHVDLLFYAQLANYVH